MCAASAAEARVFQGTVDRYSGVTVPESALPDTAEEFHTMLQDSLEVWAEEGRRVAWIRVPIDKGWCTPMAAKQGFTLHHALDDTLMLVRWLSQEEENKVPHYPHNFVGVGAAVLRQGGSSGPQLLVVTERYSDGTLDRWKLPGGMVEPGQGIGEAAERECLEETGIQAEFMSLLGVRHSHGVAFGRSDLYFVALLRPTDPDQPIQLDPSEISKCQWMEVHHLSPCLAVCSCCCLSLAGTTLVSFSNLFLLLDFSLSSCASLAHFVGGPSLSSAFSLSLSFLLSLSLSLSLSLFLLCLFTLSSFILFCILSLSLFLFAAFSLSLCCPLLTAGHLRRRPQPVPHPTLDRTPAAASGGSAGPQPTALCRGLVGPVATLARCPAHPGALLGWEIHCPVLRCL